MNAYSTNCRANWLVFVCMAGALGLASGTHAARAAWPASPSVGGIVVNDTLGFQEEFRIVSDGVGGVYCYWDDQRTGYRQARLKRFNAAGESPGWPGQGLMLADSLPTFESMTLSPNGRGAVVVTWYSPRDFKFHSQCVDSNGTVLWAPSGPLVLQDGVTEVNNAVAALSDGSRVYAWLRTSAVYGTRVWAMRQRADGLPAWPGPVMLREAMQDVYEPVICAVGDSAVVVAWTDTRTGAPGIYGQLLDLDGNPKWPAGGKWLMPGPGTQGRLTANGVGGAAGCYVYFGDDPTYGDLRLFNVGPDGEPVGSWPSDGLPYANEPNQSAGGIGVVTFTEVPGEILLGWRDIFDSSNGIYRVQRFDTTATPLWQGRGRAAWQATAPTSSTEGWPDGAGGFVVSVLGTSPGYDVFGQYVRPDGSGKWQFNLLPVCTAPGAQARGTYTRQLVVPDSSGGAFYCWVDYRNAATSPDLYIQHVNADGTLGGVVTATEASAISASFIQGCAEVRWHASVDPGIVFTVQRQSDGGEWAAIGSPIDEGDDLWAARDCAVERGARYAYRLEWSQDGELRHSAAISLAIPLQPEFAFSAPWPNPVRDRVTFDYSVSARSEVRVSVLDLSGRLVSVVESGVRDAGEHRLTWRAAGAGGESLEPGCYWIQLEAEGQRRARQIVIVK